MHISKLIGVYLYLQTQIRAWYIFLKTQPSIFIDAHIQSDSDLYIYY